MFYFAVITVRRLYICIYKVNQRYNYDEIRRVFGKDGPPSLSLFTPFIPPLILFGND